MLRDGDSANAPAYLRVPATEAKGRAREDESGSATRRIHTAVSAHQGDPLSDVPPSLPVLPADQLNHVLA